MLPRESERPARHSSRADFRTEDLKPLSLSEEVNLGSQERAQCSSNQSINDDDDRRPEMDVYTDPEPDMDSGRATVRNVRSKCRCSCVLQFTFRRAVSCVLHRPPSQVIHCIVWYSKKRFFRERISRRDDNNNKRPVTHPCTGGREHKVKPRQRAKERSLNPVRIPQGLGRRLRPPRGPRQSRNRSEGGVEHRGQTGPRLTREGSGREASPFPSPRKRGVFSDQCQSM